MIESITITNRAPFLGEERHHATARKLNYIFGANGVGKTTISCIIDKPEVHPEGRLRWSIGRELETLVLNRDFVKSNFGQLVGIFTLGADEKGIQEKIEQARSELDAKQKKRDGLRQNLSGEDGTGGKQAELVTLEGTFKTRCWDKTRRYKDVFKDAFKGTLSDSKKFKEKLLTEHNVNTASLKPYDDLAERAETLFGEPPESVGDVPSVHASNLLAHQSNPILGKPVIGKGDVDIAAMIKKLDNSDWVRQGRKFYDNSNGVCPFCQQATDKTFAESLEAYFDDTYDADKRVIDDLVSAYERDTDAVQEQVGHVLAESHPFVDVEKLEVQKELLDGLVRENLQTLRGKQSSPSHKVGLRSLADVTDVIKKLIDDANTHVRDHNQTVREYKNRKRQLVAEVWQFVLNELREDVKAYEREKEALSNAVKGLEKGISEADTRIRGIIGEVRELERQTTNVRSTVDEINGILKQFGFTSFYLAMSEDGQFYRLVRSNGDPAADTLSEGEKTFVVFLYFYNLLRGSKSEADINTDRVVVFDDPVSSLDSDVLFIVSSLIRGVCEDVREGRGNIKQVFVLTHNVYFYREVTYRNGSDGKALKDESFWIVRKRASGSTIKEYRENPIKTSYELLWDEVREADPNNPGLGNTMRRILEYYFKVIGGGKLDELHDQFEGTDKLLCHALLSWANAGSHHILEPDLHVPSDVSIENYQRVFRAIFKKHGHEGHYRMMMREAGTSEMEEAGNP